MKTKNLLKVGPFVVISLLFVYIVLLGLNSEPEESTHNDADVTCANDYNLLLWEETGDTTIKHIADKNCLPHVSLAQGQGNATLVIYKGDTCLLSARHVFDGITKIKTYMFDIKLSDAIYGKDSSDIILIPVRNLYKDIKPLRVSESRFIRGNYSFSAIEKNYDKSAWIHRTVRGEFRKSYKMNLGDKGHEDFDWMYMCKNIIYCKLSDYLSEEIYGSSGSALINNDNEVLGVAVVLRNKKHHELFVSVQALSK